MGPTPCVTSLWLNRHVANRKHEALGAFVKCMLSCVKLFLLFLEAILVWRPSSLEPLLAASHGNGVVPLYFHTYLMRRARSGISKPMMLGRLSLFPAGAFTPRSTGQTVSSVPHSIGTMVLDEGPNASTVAMITVAI